MFLTGAIYWALCFYDNKRRDSLYGHPVAGQLELLEEIFQSGETDGVNKHFRYSY